MTQVRSVSVLVLVTVLGPLASSLSVAESPMPGQYLVRPQFSPCSAEINDRASEVMLDNVVALKRRLPEKVLRVTGYPDPEPGCTQAALAAARAGTILAFFISHGIGPERLEFSLGVPPSGTDPEGARKFQVGFILHRKE